MVVKLRNTICPPPPQLSLHRRAALSSNSNGTRSVYSRNNPKSSLYCEMSMRPTAIFDHKARFCKEISMSSEQSIWMETLKIVQIHLGKQNNHQLGNVVTLNSMPDRTEGWYEFESCISSTHMLRITIIVARFVKKVCTKKIKITEQM
jgi:hypothetical protein